VCLYLYLCVACCYDHRLVTSNSVEEMILRRTIAKLKMTDNVIDKGNFATQDDPDTHMRDVSSNSSNSSNNTPTMAELSSDKLMGVLQCGLDDLYDEKGGKLVVPSDEEIEAIVTGGTKFNEMNRYVQYAYVFKYC